jgi:hypothetical protein
MNPRPSTAPAFVLAAALFALPAAGAQAASWPQATGPSIFDADFSNCNWTADAVSETSCGFRLGTRPVGSYDIVNESMRIRATKLQDATIAHSHTEIEPRVAGFTDGRFAHIGQAYWYGLRSYLENWTSEDSWEIITQWHGMADSWENGGRNPPVSLVVRNGRYSLVIRSDSKETTPPSGTTGRYDREEKIDLGPVISNAWVDWVFKIRWDPFGIDGSLVVWKNGAIVYEEYGQPNTFNDVRGPVWSMGLYKYFSSSQVSERRLRLDDIHAATVAANDPDQPPEPPQVPKSPELLAAETLSESAIDISWRDTSTEEAGFTIERREDSDTTWEDVTAAKADQTRYVDDNLSPSTTYTYRVTAFNAAGASTPSNKKAATTLEGIELKAFGYKKRGYHKVFLSYFGPDGTLVDIYRDNAPIETTTEEVFLDEINKRGKASYRYKICEAANPSICSPNQIITF